MLQLRYEGSLGAEFSLPQGHQPFFHWAKPTHIIEDNFYSKSINLNVNFI